MHRALVSILLAAFTLFANSAPVLWAIYAVRANAIAEAYCVNRSNPCCHGRCHVTRATQEQQKENGADTATGTLKLAALFPHAPRLFFPIATHARFQQPRHAALLAGWHRRVDHPPQHLV